MTRFKTQAELQNFLDTSMKCLCGRLLTGLHEQNCSQIKKQKARFSGEKQ